MKKLKIYFYFWKPAADRFLLFLCAFSIILAVLSVPILTTSKHTNNEIVIGTVLRGPSNGANKSSLLFAVKLKNGLVVAANGLKVVPANYRGKVKMIRSSGIKFGSDVYEIVELLK